MEGCDKRGGKEFHVLFAHWLEPWCTEVPSEVPHISSLTLVLVAGLAWSRVGGLDVRC